MKIAVWMTKEEIGDCAHGLLAWSTLAPGSPDVEKRIQENRRKLISVHDEFDRTVARHHAALDQLPALPWFDEKMEKSE